MPTRRRAASPVLATLLIVAVAISMAILSYVWTIGLTGNLMGGGGSQLKEQIIMEAYNWPAGTTAFTVTLRNVGSSAVTLANLYVGGVLATHSLTASISPGGTSAGTVTTGSMSLADGVAYTFEIVTQTGGMFTFTVTRGGTG